MCLAYSDDAMDQAGNLSLQGWGAEASFELTPPPKAKNRKAEPVLQLSRRS